MAIQPETHLRIDHSLCGTPQELGDGEATVRLRASHEMAVDDEGLIHGGFIFGLADHAAMLAVNDPNVVLGASEARFTAPVSVGDSVIASARVTDVDGKKHIVEATASVDGEEVFTATFTTFVLDHHILEDA